jgi:hypothetical protein
MSEPAMTDRKKPGVAFWTTVVVVVVILYALSVGPAACLMYRGLIPEPLWAHVETAYLPVVWVATLTDTTDAVFDWYVDLWLP